MFTAPCFERILAFFGAANRHRPERAHPEPVEGLSLQAGALCHLLEEVVMSRIRSFVTGRLILALLALVSLMQVAGHGQTREANRIAGFGSSVANGKDDEDNKGGYTCMPRDVLTGRGGAGLRQSERGKKTRSIGTSA